MRRSVARLARHGAVVAVLAAAGCVRHSHAPEQLQRRVLQVSESDAAGGPAKVAWTGFHPPQPVDSLKQQIRVDRVQVIDPTKGSVSGLGGRRVQVAIFDLGIDRHADFQSRIVLKDNDRSTHGTHVAGVVAGSGGRSSGMDSWGRPNGVIPYRWAGVAPLAELLDVRQKANNVAKWSLFVSQFGLDISNHSNSLSFDGHYDELNAVSDALVRGDAQAGGERVPPRLQVHSAGNQGQKPTSPATQVGYFSLTRQVKNALVVGNYDFLLSAISPTSSLGPTYDGRIKPDLVAPGARITSTGFCGEGFKDRCTSYPPGQALRQDFYRADSGSSFAAAGVTGGLALVLEQYGTTYGVNLDASPPLPSTLRGIAIHSARDLDGGPWKGIGEAPVMAFPGPDFVTGWGLLDVAQAVLTVRRREILESSLRATCDSVEVVFAVPTDTSLKVTLAWDDPAAPLDRPPGAPLLVNDLDLVLVAPDGTRNRPWLLDQVAVNELGAAVGDNEQRCGTALGIQRRARPGPPEAAGMDPVLNAFQPAVRGRDHLNNVEQVLVQSARGGEWRAWVIGFGIPQGPQRFSLIGIVPKQ